MVHVLAVRAGMRESLETLLALKGLLAAVKSLVLGEVVLVLESLAAHITLVWSLARVFVLVTRQRALLAESLITLVTSEEAFALVVVRRVLTAEQAVAGALQVLAGRRQASTLVLDVENVVVRVVGVVGKLHVQIEVALTASTRFVPVLGGLEIALIEIQWIVGQLSVAEKDITQIGTIDFVLLLQDCERHISLDGIFQV